MTADPKVPNRMLYIIMTFGSALRQPQSVFVDRMKKLPVGVALIAAPELYHN